MIRIYRRTDWQSILKLQVFSRPYRRILRRAATLDFLRTLITLPMPWITMIGIDRVMRTKDASALVVLLFIWTGAILGSSLLNFLSENSMIRFETRSAFNLHTKLFKHIQILPLPFFHERQSGYLACRIIDDVDNVSFLVGRVWIDILRDAFLIVAGLTLLILISWRLALLTASLLPLYFVNSVLFAQRIKKKSESNRENWGNMYGRTNEALSNPFTTKCFLREGFEVLRFAARLKKTVRDKADFLRTCRFSEVLGGFTRSICPIAVFIFGGLEMMKGTLSVGEFVGFLGYISYLYDPITDLYNINLRIHRCLPNAERILRILEMRSERSGHRGNGCRRLAGAIRFEDVSFSYDHGKPTLQKINLLIREGEFIGIVGPSGAGKSTLVRLIPRFYRPSQGAITIGSTDIGEIPLAQLRAQIGIIGQDTLLFQGTIRENIRYGRLDSSEKEVKMASRIANLDEFIDNLPAGYDTEIGERGVRISGGERQRLAIARIVLKNPRILILDEATAYVDADTERSIQESLKYLLEGRTTIVVAHRFSTIKDANRIILISDGKIVDEGKHEELVQKNEMYGKLYETQPIGGKRE